MAQGDIKPGYLGILDLNGQKIRCTAFNVVPRQEPLFYDHIIGLRDSIPSTVFDDKQDDGSLNAQKKFWRPSVKIYQGGISYPMTQYSANKLACSLRSGNGGNKRRCDNEERIATFESP